MTKENIIEFTNILLVLTILKISVQLTLEVKISGETGSVFHLSKGNPSAEEANAYLGLSRGRFFKTFFVVFWEGGGGKFLVTDNWTSHTTKVMLKQIVMACSLSLFDCQVCEGI